MDSVWFLFRSIRYCLSVYLYGFLYFFKERICFRHRKFVDFPDNSGHLVVITGGTRGIGLEVVKKLLQCNTDVIVGCRKSLVGKSVMEAVRDSGITTGTVQCLQLDLASMDSVRRFAAEVLNKNKPVSTLINNAGVMFVPYSETVDGFESHFATNYLGHFLLTHLLLPRLREAGTSKRNARIVNVSSMAHFFGNIDFNDIHMRNYYCPQLGYGRSKLAQLLFMRSLDSNLQMEGSHVKVNSVHPGIILTDLYKHMFIIRCTQYLGRLLFKSPTQGADTILHAALSPDLEGVSGKYLENSKDVHSSTKARDEQTQNKLWNISCVLLNIEQFGKS